LKTGYLPLRSIPSSLTTGRGYVKNSPLKLAGFVDITRSIV
jgi:hypothetical protein